MVQNNYRLLLSAVFAVGTITLPGSGALGQVRQRQDPQAAGPVVAGMVIALPAHSLIYCPSTKMLYASVTVGGSGETTNSITGIDPISGSIGRSVRLSKEPGDLALSSGERFLYTASSDGASIQRVNLTTFAAGPAFPVGSGLAESKMAAVPGVPEAIAIARHRLGISPDNAGMAVYLNGLPTGETTEPGHQLAQGIAPGRWFGYENLSSAWSFYTLNIGREGVTSGGSTGSLISGNQAIQSSASGLLVTGGGSVIDPEARQVLGAVHGLADDNLKIFTGESHLLALASTGRIYGISGKDGVYLLKAATLQTQTSLGAIRIDAAGVKGAARNLVYAGDNRLAFTTGSSVVIVPINLGPRLPDVDLSVKRSKMPTGIARGSEITYTLTVKNSSVTPASHVFLTDQMLPGVEPISATASQGDAIVTERILRADLGKLEPGAAAIVTVKVRVTEADKMGFAAVVRGVEPDPSPDNNLDIFDLSAMVQLPDLTVAWTAAQQEANGAGINLRVTLHGLARVTNIGKRTSGPTTVRFWAGAGPNFVPRLYLLLQEVDIPGLAPGEWYDAELKAELGPGDDGTGVFFFAQVDARNLVEEKRKDNNVARTQMK